MRTKTILFVVALCCFTISSSLAQDSKTTSSPKQLKECRTVAGQAAIEYEQNVDRAAYRQKMQQYQNNNNARAIVQYPVQFHIVTRDDGTGGVDINDIRTELDDFINPYFAAIDVEFVECNIELYHNSTEYYVLGNGTEDPDVAGDAMSVTFNVPDVINIYFVNDPDSACGWARFPWKLPSDYIVIANSCADNKSTTVHELGHYFGLYHTHHAGMGAESVTRNNGDGCWNCESAGDLLCDTPADPNLSSLASNFPSCAYFGTETDACNSDAYSPAIDNIMSYADKECRVIFTSEQRARMEVFRDGDRNYLQTGCPCEKPEAICKNIVVNLDAAGNASITPSDVNNGSTWDCGFGSWSVSPNTFDCSDLGPSDVVEAAMVTLTVIDDLGWESTCIAEVSVLDVTDPIITTQASNMAVECDGNGNTTQFNNWLNNNAGAVASDECGGTWSNNSTGLSDGCGATGSETVTFTFSDASGNSAATIATFTIEDNTQPDLECPDDIHLPECVPTASWTVNSSDVCGDVTVVSSPPSGSVFPKGTTTIVTVTSTDDCGNENECTFTVTRDPDLEVDIDALPTSPLNTCALGTNANIVLGYGGGPVCLTLNAVGSGGHAPYTYAWSSPAEVPAGSFIDDNTSSPTFCADFQTDPCVTYTFLVEVTDIHGCTEIDEVQVNVVNPICKYGNNTKVSVCHRPPGNPANEHTNCLSSNGTGTHLDKTHDDCLGACDAVCVSYSPNERNQFAQQENYKLDAYVVAVQPNPFSSTAKISYSSSHNAEVQLYVIDISGRIVANLFEGSIVKGMTYTTDFNSKNLHSGIYIVRLIGSDGISTNSTIILER